MHVQNSPVLQCVMVLVSEELRGVYELVCRRQQGAEFSKVTALGGRRLSECCELDADSVSSGRRWQGVEFL